MDFWPVPKPGPGVGGTWPQAYANAEKIHPQKHPERHELAFARRGWGGTEAPKATHRLEEETAEPLDAAKGRLASPWGPRSGREIQVFGPICDKIGRSSAPEAPFELFLGLSILISPPASVSGRREGR